MPSTNQNSYIQTLPEGALDIIGDIHGELTALEDLLHHLGYDQNGNHPDNRTLVFVGDFVDRGANTPGVIKLVRRLMQQGRAVAVLGNHELNVLVNDAKSGSSWWFAERLEQDLTDGYGVTEQVTCPTEKQQLLEWLAALPVALEREDLRVIHAAWHTPSLAAIKNSTESLKDIYLHYEAKNKAAFENSALAKQLYEELNEWEAELENQQAAMPRLKAVAEKDVRYQMNNPLRVLTSGTEEIAEQPFFASNKWRFCNRGKWWQDYDEAKPVVIGHYSKQQTSKGVIETGVFEGEGIHSWVGKQGNVFCNDYGIGYKYLERAEKKTKGKPRLAALRWPERTLMFDDGEVQATKGFLEAKN